MSLGIEGPNVCEIKVQFELSRMNETLHCKKKKRSYGTYLKNFQLLGKKLRHLGTIMIELIY